MVAKNQSGERSPHTRSAGSEPAGRPSGHFAGNQTRGRTVLSKFIKLPDKITFAACRFLDNWQVRERISTSSPVFGRSRESIILPNGLTVLLSCRKTAADAGLPDDLKYMLLVESKCISAAYSKAKRRSLAVHPLHRAPVPAEETPSEMSVESRNNRSSSEISSTSRFPGNGGSGRGLLQCR